jgi:hypothetical protein
MRSAHASASVFFEPASSDRAYFVFRSLVMAPVSFRFLGPRSWRCPPPRIAVLAWVALGNPPSWRRHLAFLRGAIELLLWGHSSPIATSIAMDKDWPFRKIKNGREVGSSSTVQPPLCSCGVRAPPVGRERMFPWPNAGLPGGGWHLNSHRVLVPTVLHEGLQRP